MSEKPTYEELEQQIQALKKAESERKQAAEKLKKSRTEEDLAQIFSMSLDLICIADIHTATFIKVNPAFTEILGYSEESLLEKPFLDFVHPDDLDATRRVIEQKLKTGAKVIDFENRYRCQDGTYRWLSWVSHPNPDKGVTYAIARDITQTKLTEAKLKESEEQFRRLAENSPDMIYRMSLPDGNYEYVSPAAEKISGYPPKAWYENRLLIQKIIHPHWHSYFEKEWKRLLEGEVTPAYEYQILHKDGDVRWIDQRNVAVRDTEGNLLAIEGIVTDVTGRKKAEAALVKKDAMLANIASQVPGMLYQFMITPNGRYTVPYSSKGVKAIFGCSPEDVRNDFTPIFNTVYPDDREKILQTIEESLKSMSQWMCEYRVQVPGKPIKWVYGNSFPEKREDGSIVWSGYNVEITKLRQAEAALRESEAQFRHFFQHLTIGVAVYEAVDNGEDFRFTDMNPAGQQLSRVSIDEIRGKRLTQIFSNAEDLGLLKALGDTWRTGRPFHLPFRQYKDDRITQWIENRIFKLPSGNVVAVYEDRTELVRLEEGLRQAQKMEAIGRLAGGVAHDFNNMLSIISGNTEMAIEDADDHDPIVPMLQEIQKAANRSTDLTRQLLAFARKQTISPKVLDLNDTIEGMLKMLRRLIGEDIDLTWLPKPGLWPIKVDTSQIDQILANLCVNARDAIGGVGKVTIETDNVSFDAHYCRENEGFKPGEYVMLGVSDNGCGMNKETRENLFEPFFTTKDFGQGTGLGLSTVYGIVKQNSGFIHVYSELEKGTTFRLYFGKYASNPQGAEDSPTVETAVGGTETILLVEDEVAILRLSKMMLERLGYTVLSALGPLEALQISQSHSHDIQLLMTDVVMPEMNGRDLAEKLLVMYPDMKCLFMSGYTANVIAHHGVLDEGIQFINKPFSKHALAKIVRKAIDQGNEIFTEE